MTKRLMYVWYASLGIAAVTWNPAIGLACYIVGGVLTYYTTLDRDTSGKDWGEHFNNEFFKNPPKSTQEERNRLFKGGFKEFKG